MAINYLIQADVVDIASDAPKGSDAFLVDTNVWYWMTYPNAATSAFPSQLSEYPAFVNAALAARAKICCTGLSLAELSHLIESTERLIYEKTVANIKPKEYRHNFPAERTRVVFEVQAAWGQVRSLASTLALTIDDTASEAALNRFQAEKVDGYDLFILEAMRHHGVVQIITDDGDFATVTGIQVFTANRNVISSARTQGRLLTR